MQYFELYDTLKSYCQTNGIHFVFGSLDYVNYELTQKDYAPDELVMVAELTMRPNIRNSQVTGATYTGIIMLGRKFEASTVASLEERYEEKYNNRLKDLIQLFVQHLATFGCENELGVQCSLRYDINKFDTNIDFVVGDVTLTL